MCQHDDVGAMALHAVDDLSDAYRATKSFLLPMEWGRWLRLALLSLFVAGSGGGGGGFSSGWSGTPTTQPPSTGPTPGSEFDQFTAAFAEHLWLIVGVGAAVLLLGLVLQWLASAFEFTFLESLRTDAVHVRQYTSEYAGLGTRLFAFRLLFGLLSVLVVGGLLLLVLGPIFLGVAPAGPILLAVFAIPLLIVLGILGSVIYVFTTAFVAPIMLLEERGVISAWKRFWGVFKSAWEDFLVYVLVGLFLMIAIGILVGIVMTVIGVALVLPVLAVLLALGPLPAVLVGIPLGLLGIVATALVQVPVQTYLRHWSLLVLGDVEPDLDLIPDRRATVRGETSSSVDAE